MSESVRVGCAVSELLPLDLGDIACRGKCLTSLLEEKRSMLRIVCVMTSYDTSYIHD